MQQESNQQENYGFGAFDYVNGDIYIGHWEIIDGIKVRHGHGKYIHSLTPIPPPSKADAYQKLPNLVEEYEGAWENDQMHGYGIYQYVSGAIYDGEWKNGLQHGSGVYKFPNGTKYKGYWKKQQIHGRGVYIDTQGNNWEGIYVEGTFDSTIQNRLQTEYEEIEKIKVLKVEGRFLLSVLQDIFQHGKKSEQKFEIEKRLVLNPGEVDKFIDGPYVHWSDLQPEQWEELCLNIQGAKYNILRNKNQAQLINSGRINGQQLNGRGQIIEFTKQTDSSIYKLASVLNDEDNWLIIFAEISSLE